MNYPEFETAFEAQFQKHTVSYPHAVEYHRARFNQTIQYLLSSILEQADTLIQQPETNWAHTEEIVSDILYCGEITVEQLFALELPTQLTADRDFEAVKTKLYETKYYPIREHLNYIAFPPALERKTFIGKHLDCFKEKSHFCDLGFGPGVLTAFILQQNASWQAEGVDVSQHCLHHAQRLLEKKIVLDRSKLSVGDVRSLHYPDDTFDGVIAVEVLEHIPDPETGLLEAMRVLKPGGYLITALPVQLPLLMHLYDFDSPDEVLALYEKVGLKIIDFETKEFQHQSDSFIDTFALSVKL
ncbi:class I SAM-dependent methyltransferase [Candidatus Poribacteria bacterium]|nr:class I SAM-dependent methyltransferase [Candidatus Poribacteria bacterium]MYA54874.1 class I SAM-dependent methyltransferase [Candidatus Poribacteria bacterium]